MPPRAARARASAARGRVVDVALADVLASYVAGNCRIYTNYGLKWQRAGRRAYASGRRVSVRRPAVQGRRSLPVRTHARRVGATGRRDGPPRVVAGAALPGPARDGQAVSRGGRRLIMPWLAQHTKAEIEELATRHNLVVSPIRNFADVLATPQFTLRGFWKRAHVGGKDVQGPGLPFKIVDERARRTRRIARGRCWPRAGGSRRTPRQCRRRTEQAARGTCACSTSAGCGRRRGSAASSPSSARA